MMLKQRAIAIGMWVMRFSVGPAIGPLVGGALIMAVLAGCWFIKRQQTARPFIDLSLFTRRRFRLLILTYTVVFFLVFAMFYFLAQYLQLIRDMSPLEAGLWMLPWAIVFTYAYGNRFIWAKKLTKCLRDAIICI